MDSDHRVSCVLPAYNEAASLGDTVERWAAALGRCTREYEIIVVDDGSEDGTAVVLRALADRYDRLRVVTHGTNLGYGAAIVNGFAHAALPLVFFTDADGQYEPDDIRLLLNAIPSADLAVGYRRRRADPRLRCMLSRGYNFLARRLLGLTLRDLNCAFKLMRRETADRLRPESTGFSVNAELVANAQSAGMRIVEIPVRHQPRHAGRSTVRPFHVVLSLYGLARLRLRRRAVSVRQRGVDACSGTSESAFQ
ncbi:MAG TPA: glycosyltransferase family 2 protein [Candidatus Binatia bacterium]|nr:glycosyltransferase family 2 protein [Candidatus Binatia bacterium]